MNKKALNPSIVPRNNDDLSSKTGNIYESISLISKRSRQLNTKHKEELSEKLAEFASTTDNLDEIFENKEQIEISKYYERLPKPTIVAIHEFLNDELEYRIVEKGSETSKDSIL